MTNEHTAEATAGVLFDPVEHPHRRYNPLVGKHVLVSPHRTRRPWNGQTEEPVLAKLPEYDPKCYLCPGNTRSSGDVNPQYKDTFVFVNDFPALLSDPLPFLPPSPNYPADSPATEGNAQIDALFTSTPVRGRCKVICYSPRHDLTLARMEVPDIVHVVEGWKGIYQAEGDMLRKSGSPEGHVQIFENRGSMMGASAPHPHGQVWSLSYVPDEPAVTLANMQKYADTAPSPPKDHPLGPFGKPSLLVSYAHEEVKRKERVIELDEDGGWVAVVPFWATWPYEILLTPYKRHIPSLLQLTTQESQGLARILQRVLVRYDNLFSCPFPYSMGIHQSPLPPLKPEEDIAHIHFHFYPPLLRSASVRKFLVGFELLGESQRDLTPEQAASKLRSLPDKHYQYK